jgi:hypothetical protein
LDVSDQRIYVHDFHDVTLRCDRTAQWREFEECFPTLRGTLLVAGAEEEAHEHFLARLGRNLSGRADVIECQLGNWRPESETECDALLSDKLGSPNGELARRVLAERCRTQKVVVVTKPAANLAIQAEQKWVEIWFDYVRSVFDLLHKELGDQPGVRWPLFVQPVSWPRRRLRELAARVHLRRFLRPKKDDRLEFVALPPLHRIRPHELLAFFDEEASAVFAGREECESFVNEVSREKTSLAILRRVDEKVKKRLREGEERP